MKKYLGIVMGLLFILGSFLINNYSVIRLILIIIGLIVIFLNTLKLFKNKMICSIICIFLILVSTFVVDNFFTITLKRIPIFAKKVISSKKVITFDSIFYRLFDCGKKLVVDVGYEKNYVCAQDDLDLINVNSFLSEALESFADYKNRFVKIEGKVSKIVGIDTIEMSFYENGNSSLNGHVLFSQSSIVRIKTKDNLKNYRIYDDLIVVGRVKSLSEEKGINYINLDNTKLYPKDYSKYSIEVINNEEDKAKDYVIDKKYYLYGLDDIFIKYDANNIYELKYVISDARLTLADLLLNEESKDIFDHEKNLIGKYYELEKFNVVICNKENKTYFSNKNKDNFVKICK